MNEPSNDKNPVGGQESHGLSKLKDSVKRLGSRAIDRRTVTGKALAEWREEIIQDLGGNGSISAMQRQLVDLAVKSKLLLDSIDTWLLTQKSLINSRKRALLPVVRERQALADGLARYLAQLGLERKSKPVSLSDYFQDPPGGGGGGLNFPVEAATLQPPPERSGQEPTDSQGDSQD